MPWMSFGFHCTTYPLVGSTMKANDDIRNDGIRNIFTLCFVYHRVERLIYLRYQSIRVKLGYFMQLTLVVVVLLLVFH